ISPDLPASVFLVCFVSFTQFRFFSSRSPAFVVCTHACNKDSPAPELPPFGTNQPPWTLRHSIHPRSSKMTSLIMWRFSSGSGWRTLRMSFAVLLKAGFNGSFLACHGFWDLFLRPCSEDSFPFSDCLTVHSGAVFCAADNDRNSLSPALQVSAQLAAPQPFSAQLAAPQPFSAQLAASQPFSAQLAASQPFSAQLAASQPFSAQLAASQPFSAQSAASQPFSAQSAASQPFSAQSAASRPFSAQLAASRPFSAQLAASRPFSAQLAASRPFSAQLAASRPFSAQLAASRPFSAQLAASRPFSAQLAASRPFHSQLS
uniref:Uncharacterized protein n=1 Tax=Oreochromis niloticus TaxID=8128 RepID=A0A669BSD9_ORENI